MPFIIEFNLKMNVIFDVFEKWIESSELHNKDRILDRIRRKKQEEDLNTTKKYSRFDYLESNLLHLILHIYYF